jgi:hypothetical protein
LKEYYEHGGLFFFFLNFDFLNQKTVEQLMCETWSSIQYIKYLSESTSFKIRYFLTTLHFLLLPFPSDIATDMDATLSDTHHKDGTHYSTGLLDIREYTGEFQNERMEIFDSLCQILVYMQFVC